MKLMLADGHTLENDGTDSTITTPRGPVRFSDLSETQLQSLDLLASGVSERDLIAALPEVEEQIWARMIVNRLISLAILSREHHIGIRIEVIGDGY